MDEPPILRNSPLQAVVIELRFPAGVYLPEDLKKIRQGLKNAYPISDTEHGVGIEVSPQGAVRQQDKMQRQVYRSLDGSHQIGLNETGLVLEGKGPSYEGFEYFLERWITAVEVVAPIADVTSQLRLGLRYVNQLQVQDVEAGIRAVDGRVNHALLSPLDAEGFTFNIRTAVQELRLKGESGQATLRHGLQVLPGANPPAVYMIDIDAYDEELRGFDLAGHVETLKQLNSEAWRLFRWSVTDSEFEDMKPETRKSDAS